MRCAPNAVAITLQQESASVGGAPITREGNALEDARAANCALAAGALRSSGTLSAQVTGCSMLPSLWPGDLLLISRREVDQILPGDIVLFARSGRLIIHRVVIRTVECESTHLTTRGDAVAAEDLRLAASEVLGRVSFILRGRHWIEPSRQLSFGARVFARLVCHSTRVASVLVRLRMLWQRAGRGKEEILCRR